MSNYTYYSGTTTADKTALINAFYTTSTGLSIDYENSTITYGTFQGVDYSSYEGLEGYEEQLSELTSSESGTSISYYDGQLSGLNIGKGILLTSGTANPSTSNTQSGYTTQLTYDTQPTDADLSASAKAAFSGSGDLTDMSVIDLSFTVTDPFIHGIRFDLAFGSDEYPEFSDSSYVDIAGVYLNGQNIALFNNDATQPLSVISNNLSIGNFRDNQGGTLPIEYDGMSDTLTIFAPIQPGTNTLKIAIADTGDQAYDSGLFISNLQGTQLTGSGLSGVTYGSESADTITGGESNETFDTGAGDDTINPGLGNDIILAGAGNDTIIGGHGDNQIDGGDGIDTITYDNLTKAAAYVKVMDNDTIHIGANSDTILNVENIQFKDGLYDTETLLIEDDVAKIYVAYFGRSADPEGMKFWVDQTKAAIASGTNYNDALSSQINSFALSTEAESMYEGINSGTLDSDGLSTFINSIYQNLFDRTPDQAGLDYWVSDAQTLQSQGKSLGSIIKTIIDGALDSPESLDRTMIQNKAQVAWDYAKQYELAGKEWDESMTNEAQTVLTGITTASDTVNSAYNDIIGFTS